MASNSIAEKDRELGDAHAEIRALKYSERLKERGVEEVMRQTFFFARSNRWLTSQFSLQHFTNYYYFPL